VLRGVKAGAQAPSGSEGRIGTRAGSRSSSASGTMVGAPALPRARRALEPHQARSALLRAYGLERVRQAVPEGGGREQCERALHAGGFAGSAHGL
jgi:hypothetical protein